MLQTYLLKAIAWRHVSLDSKMRSDNICYSWGVVRPLSGGTYTRRKVILEEEVAFPTTITAEDIPVRCY